MTTEAPLRGLALLDAVIAHITAHPETWDQEDYRCETGMCVAGWADELAGGTWYASSYSESAWYLLAEDDDPKRYVRPMADGTLTISADRRARRLIGAPARFFGDDDDDYGDYTNLFAGTNDLDDIIRIRDEIAEWFASQEQQ